MAEIEDTTGLSAAYDDVLEWLGFTMLGGYRERTTAYVAALRKERRGIFKRAAQG